MKLPTISEDFIYAKRKEIGQKLKQMREAKGLTMEQVAEQLNITAVTVSKIEAGKLNIKIDELIGVLVILECDIEFVMN